MGATLERIIEQVRALPPDERRRLREMLNDEQPDFDDTLTPDQQQRAALIRSVRGKYRDVLTSSEVFTARKAEEMALEDRRR